MAWLSILNDDCLLIVIKFLAEIIYESRYDTDRKDRQHLENFSITCSRLRELCIPKLFKLDNFSILALGEPAQALKTIAGSSFMPGVLR